jgi:hypothetical protein
LEQLGTYICNIAVKQGYDSQYIIGKNQNGVDRIILILDNKTYTHTRYINDIENIYRLWERVTINHRSIIHREITGKGLRFSPIHNF